MQPGTQQDRITKVHIQSKQNKSEIQPQSAGYAVKATGATIRGQPTTTTLQIQQAH
jgi:hypothetical protein